MTDPKSYLFAEGDYKGSLAFPKHLDLELNTACNGKCVMCDRSGFHNGMMYLEAALKIITYMAKNGTKSIKPFWRGEPTLYQMLPHVLKHAKEAGLFTMLNTNGSFLLNNAKEIADHLDWISFSVDRHHGNIEGRVFGLIKYFSDRGVYTEVQAGESNPAVAEFCSKNNIIYKEDVFVRRTLSGDYEAMTLDKFPRTYCKFPEWRIIITWNLAVKPCCVAWKDYEAPLGFIDIDNLETIKEIWYGPKYEQFRADLKAGRYPDPACIMCTSKSAYMITR